MKKREKAQCLKAHTIILQKNRIQFLVPTMDGSQECMTPVPGDLKPSTMACTCTQMHRHAHNHNLNLYQKKSVGDREGERMESQLRSLRDQEKPLTPALVPK